jgi:hypothetical protein
METKMNQKLLRPIVATSIAAVTALGLFALVPNRAGASDEITMVNADSVNNDDFSTVLFDDKYEIITESTNVDEAAFAHALETVADAQRRTLEVLIAFNVRVSIPTPPMGENDPSLQDRAFRDLVADAHDSAEIRINEILENASNNYFEASEQLLELAAELIAVIEPNGPYPNLNNIPEAWLQASLPNGDPRNLPWGSDHAIGPEAFVISNSNSNSLNLTLGNYLYCYGPMNWYEANERETPAHFGTCGHIRQFHSLAMDSGESGRWPLFDAERRVFYSTPTDPTIRTWNIMGVIVSGPSIGNYTKIEVAQESRRLWMTRFNNMDWRFGTDRDRDGNWHTRPGTDRLSSAHVYPQFTSRYIMSNIESCDALGMMMRPGGCWAYVSE